MQEKLLDEAKAAAIGVLSALRETRQGPAREVERRIERHLDLGGVGLSGLAD
jgi:hypothetical protein